MVETRFSEKPSDVQNAIAMAAAAGRIRKTSEHQLAINDIEEIKKYADAHPEFTGTQIAILVGRLARDGATRSKEYSRKATSIVRQHRMATVKKSKRQKAPLSPTGPSLYAGPTGVASGLIPEPQSIAAKPSAACMTIPLPSPAAPISVPPASDAESGDLTEADLAPRVYRPFKGKVFLGPGPLKQFYIAVDRKHSLQELQNLTTAVLGDAASIEYMHTTLHPDDADIFYTVSATVR